MKNWIFAAALIIALPASAADRLGEASDYLLKTLGGTRVSLTGHTPDTYSDCSIDFEVDELGTHAFFFYTNPTGPDLERGFFQIVPATKMKTLQYPTRKSNKTVLEVENLYTDKAGKKDKYLQRMEITFKGDGSIDTVGIGWDLTAWAPVMPSYCKID